MANALPGLARRLVSDNLLDIAQARSAVASAVAAGIPLVSQLVISGTVDSKTIALAAAEEFGVPLLDLAAFDLQQCPVYLIDSRLIKKHHLLPLFRRANRLYVAVSDPGNNAALDEIKFHTGFNVDMVAVEEEKLHAAIITLVDVLPSSAGTDGIKLVTGASDINVEIMATEHLDETSPVTDDAPVVKFVNQILLDAFRQGASDIHFEPYESICRIRFRIDGILRESIRPPVQLSTRITSRLKIMAELDISERRVPQDGRIKVRIPGGRAIDLRVNTMPTLWGEKIVLRILDSNRIRMGIDALGFEIEQKRLFLDALRQQQGLVLVTGPTGSGKSVTLYSGLNLLNIAERNISTIEDPVEINLEGVNQVQVNHRTGVDFATILRALLRQDPDVIMLGEIRDLETADIAIKAAQTGHLVLSTLHTNNASESISRLLNMGVAKFNLASAVKLIIAQRLARKLCRHCKVIVTLPEKVLIAEGFCQTQLQQLTLFRPTGCNHCRNGFVGRIGIYEVVPITDSMSRIIISGADSYQIADQARKAGHIDLRQSALRKVALGKRRFIRSECQRN